MRPVTVLLRALLVAAGGAVGTAGRLALGLIIPDAAGISLSTLVVNLLGSFLLGVLAARLPGSSNVRILLGTGALGGFTTYSAFMTGSVLLWQSAPLLAAAVALVSVLLGVAAAALGLRAARPPRASAARAGG